MEQTFTVDAARDHDVVEGKGTGVRAALDAFLLSANIACAVMYAACLYVARNLTTETARDDSAYYFLRGVVRVAELFHRNASTPVVTSAVGRNDSILWRPGLLALTVLLTYFSAAFLVHLPVNMLLHRMRFSLFQYIAGVSALFGAPLFCVGAWQITSNWANDYSTAGIPFGRNVLAWILTAEISGFFSLSALSVRRIFPRWLRGILLFFHFVFWAVVLFPNFIFYIGDSRIRLLVHITTWLIPSAGAAFLIYLWPSSHAELRPTRVGKWFTVGRILGAMILLLIWIPNFGHHQVRSTNQQQTVVELSRGPCFGSCPVYSATIRGNGSVEFEGQQMNGREQKESGNSDRQFADVIAALNRVDFWDLEDRAFLWCFDTPSVAITVSSEGWSKRVSSDSACTGAKSGHQAAFVQAANEIDKIVGSDRWVLCGGHRCR